jgi:hypothetical protein
MEHTVKDKYAKMVRVYKRLEKISTDNGQKISNTEAKDAAEEFFNQCYHLKDFFKKDASILVNGNVIEEYINNDPNLSLAADYCNTFKHAGLNRRPRSGKIIEKINTHIYFHHPTDKGISNLSRIEFKVDGKSYDVFDVATECLKAWNNFLKSNNLQNIIDLV